ncbi:hypothetical protein TNCV_2210771 [Trichonephila clavipes]|nr:hypothetical protein TNCV_2210771 [Trichonephila clavipes]
MKIFPFWERTKYEKRLLRRRDSRRMCRPSGLVVSDADWGAVGTGRRAASPLVWLVEKVKRWEAPDHLQVSSLKIGVKTSQIVLSHVWYSKLRLTKGVT